MSEPVKRYEDSFGTFLKSFEAKTKPGTKRGGRIESLLQILAAADESMVSDLMKKSEMDIEEFLRALSSLRETDLIVLEGEPGDQRVTLTTQGRMLAEAAS